MTDVSRSTQDPEVNSRMETDFVDLRKGDKINTDNNDDSDSILSGPEVAKGRYEYQKHDFDDWNDRGNTNMKANCPIKDNT